MIQTMISPTGNKIRVADKNGSGLFGASRDGGKRRHGGVDFIGEPGQQIVSPIDGRILRVAYPYVQNWDYMGVLIRGDDYDVKIFYMTPYPDIIGKEVVQGQGIGLMQDITKKYPNVGMTPHVHIQVHLFEENLIDGDRLNPELLFEKSYR